MSALEAVRARRSQPRVSDAAPTHEELVPLVAAAATVADHTGLHPWRLIELRGDDRVALGAVIARVNGADTPSPKPLRAPLLLAIVCRPQPSEKVPQWEQETSTAGVAHMLSLLLDEAGWGVIWRTGHYTRSPEVARLHGLGPTEELMGWLYIGGRVAPHGPRPRRPLDIEQFLGGMPPRDA